MNYPTHYIKRNAQVWDTTHDDDGGCKRLMKRRTDVSIVEPRPARIRNGDLAQFKTADGRTLWADITSYESVK